MSYLINKDFASQILTDNLNQVIGNDQTVLDISQNRAIEIAKEHLSQKFDLTTELADVFVWDKAKAYNARDRVFLNPALFDANLAYAANDYVCYQVPNSVNIYVYKSKAGSTAHAFNAAEWTLICPQYQIFYAQYPYPTFDYLSTYNLADKVFWKGKVYTNAVATIPYGQSSVIQFSDIQNVPYNNVAPDDLANGGLQTWGAGTAYTIAVNTDILDTTAWTMGDNRCQSLVTALVNITLHHVHMRIAPRSIPEVRERLNHDAIQWLKDAAHGNIFPNLPVFQPLRGQRVRYGGHIKQINTY